MRPTGYLAPLLLLSSLSAAWPWQNSHDGSNAAQPIEGHLKRQDTETPAPASTPTSDSAAVQPTKSNNDGSSATESARQTGAGRTTTFSAPARASTKASNTTVFDPRLGPGGIQILEPTTTTGPTYFKIGEWVTFAWNYTSLSVTPTAVDVLATCSANQATYTIAVNHTVEPTGRVLWDTGAFQSSATTPLLTEMYTLIIYDAQSSVSAAPRAGYLSTFRLLTFGMYEPKDPVEWKDYKCPSCNSGVHSSERQALGVLFMMTTITVLSFTWFAGNFGVF